MTSVASLCYTHTRPSVALEAWLLGGTAYSRNEDEAVGLGVATRHRWIAERLERGCSFYGGMYGENKGEEEGATSFGCKSLKVNATYLIPAKALASDEW